MGDFNSHTGVAPDFEQMPENECLIFEESPSSFYFDTLNITNRVNKDKCLNHNGNKLIELCKISYLKIVNGRIGTDKSFGNYTCHTTKGQSTIDYVVMSMELFPKTMDFYIDTLDRCMSDVHCPVWSLVEMLKWLGDRTLPGGKPFFCFLYLLRSLFSSS